MNLNPRNWFLSQKIIFLLILIVYITMSLTPWYYNLGIEEAENKGLMAIAMSKLNDSGLDNSGNETEFQRKYANEGRLSSLDMLIVTGYLLSLTYVFGLFLTSVKNAIVVNIPVFLLLSIKTISIFKLSEMYTVSVRNVILWWVCLIIYYIAFFIHNNSIVTDIEKV